MPHHVCRIQELLALETEATPYIQQRQTPQPPQTYTTSCHRQPPLCTLAAEVLKHWPSLSHAPPRSFEACVASCTSSDSAASSRLGLLLWLSLCSWFLEPLQKPQPSYTPHAWQQECRNPCFSCPAGHCVAIREVDQLPLSSYFGMNSTP